MVSSRLRQQRVLVDADLVADAHEVRAELLAEIGDCRERYPTRDALAADAGMSPVAVESGKRKVACFRYACDKRLRDAVACLADASCKHNPWAHDVYQRALARGHDHPHATSSAAPGSA